MLLLNIVAVAAFLGGLAALLATMVPLETVHGYVARLTTNGSQDALLMERYARAVPFLRLSAALLISAAAIVTFNRRRLAALLEPAGASIAAQARALRSSATDSLRAWWRTERIDLFVLAGLVCFGLALRVRYLFQPLAFDEALTYGTFASRPLLVTISHYSEPNNHIFHSVLVHLSCAVFGDDLWTVRLPALAAGVTLIPAAYVVFRLLYNRNTALVTAALVASLAPMLEFSVYARGYSLITLFFVVLLGIGAALLSGAPRLLWLPFVVVGAIGFYTVPTMLYPFGIVMCWMGMSVMADRFRSPVTPRHLALAAGLTVALTAMLYSPVAVVSGLEAISGNRWVASVSWPEFAAAVPQLARSVAKHWHRDLPAGADYVLFAAFAAGLFWHPKRSAYRVPVAIAAVLWIGAALVAQRVIPFVRTWIFLVPIYASTAAVGFTVFVEWAGRRILRVRGDWYVPIAACLLAAWIGAGVVWHVTAFRPSGGTFVEAPDIMSSVERAGASSERVIVSPAAYIMLRAYARLDGFAFDRYVTRSENAANGLVVVNEAWNETAGDNLLEAGVPPGHSSPQLLLRVGAAAVYRW